MKESKLQRKVKDAILEKYPGAWYYHPRDISRRGIPDIILIVKGKFIAIELKKNLKENKPSKIQLYNIMKIREAGGYSFYADTVEDVMCLLAYYLD